MKNSDKYTVAVDFDGVIHSYTSPWTKPHEIPDPPVPGAIEWLYTMLRAFNVVIHSTRCRTWRGRRAIRTWLWRWSGAGNPGSRAMWEDWDPLATIALASKKPPALVYVDDRAYRFTGPGSWPSRDDIHKMRPWNKGGERGEI